jgi:predicted Zn-dependent protease
MKQECDRLLTAVNDEKTPVEDRLIASGKIAEFFRCNTHAVQIYELAVKLAPACLEAMARRAILFLRLGRTDDGLELASALCSKHADFTFQNLGGEPTSSLAVLGDALRLKGDNSAAAEVFSNAVALVPKDGYSNARLAETLLLSGRTSEAVKLLAHIPDRPAWQSLKATLAAAIDDPKGVPFLLGVRSKSLQSREVI